MEENANEAEEKERKGMHEGFGTRGKESKDQEEGRTADSKGRERGREVAHHACRRLARSQARKDWQGVEDLDFWIGDEAMARTNEYTVNYPIRHGIVENWDSMERYWQRCMFDFLRCDPEVSFSSPFLAWAHLLPRASSSAGVPRYAFRSTTFSSLSRH
eukprot:scaffold66129_cov35-Tisochrysis_lutea.AAC.3